MSTLEKLSQEKDNYAVMTFYHFVELKNLTEIRTALLKSCSKLKIKGTILIASEGVNSTLSGTEESINSFYDFLISIPEFAAIKLRKTYTNYLPFNKLKVRLKKEIVSFKASNLDITNTGEYLNSEEWDKLIDSNEAILIDCRNHYEITFGTFKKAIDPKTDNFSDLTTWIKNNLFKEGFNKKIGMFCTGGVRCEKSTAYLKQLGFQNVYHLRGGILQYLEDKKGQDSQWEGKLFVFDDRIAIDKNLKPINTEINV